MEIKGDVSKARFIAAFFDNLIATGFSFVAIAIVPESLPTLKLVALVGAYISYFIVFEGAWSRTVGKYFQGLVVRKLDGSRAGWKEAVVRSVLRIVEVNPVLFGAIPAGIAILSSERKQRIGDMIVNTIVVSEKFEWTAADLDAMPTEHDASTHIHGQQVHGVDVDPQTRCKHYHGENDVIAIKFKCCNAWFPCYECHGEIADHAPAVWPVAEFDERAVLCGVCRRLLTISEYLDCDSICPSCRAGFNPGCSDHYHLYFER